MGRRPELAGTDPLADLAKKMAILERELAVQRAAMERLKALSDARGVRRDPDLEEVEETHRPNVAFDRL